MSQPPAISGLHVWVRAPKTVIQRMLPLWQGDSGYAIIPWMQEAGGNVRSRVTEETGLAPDSWGAMKGMNSVSPEAKVMINLDSIIKGRDITLPTKVCLVKAMVFPVVMYGCENWTIKKVRCQRIDAFELWCWRRCLSPLDCKEIQPIHLKGNQSWIFIVRTDVVTETPILWPPDTKNWLIWKDPDAGKDQRQEEKGMREDDMVGWHHQLNGHEFEWTPGAGDGQGSLACCSPWCRKESDTLCDLTDLNWTERLASSHT